MSILKNAVESIQIGMEDYHNDDERRVLSAIRNLYAGVLLLFKYKLQQLSPEDSDEALLKTRVLPHTDKTTGKIIWLGDGKKTVDVRDITERLNALGVTGIDWKRLKGLQDIRNDIEHYYSQVPLDRMKEAVANSLHLIIQFCEPHLGEPPVEVLGQECWELMLEIATVYDTELQSCQDNLKLVTWPFEEVRSEILRMRCPECESQLVKVTDTSALRDDITFICSGCQEESLYASVVGPLIAEQMAGKNFVSVKDGGDYIIEACPECRVGAFLVSENECAACFYELEYTECDRCGERLSLEDQFLEGTCGGCNHSWEKMMAE